MEVPDPPMELATPRLALRDFAGDDWPAVHRYQSDPRYLTYYEWTERRPEDSRELVERFVAWQGERPRYRFQLAIELAGSDGLIGNCGLRRKAPDAPEADIGFELAPEHWGHGYASEATAALVEYGFRELGLARISSWCIADNAASARVMGRLGLRCEGRLRENEHFKGRAWDTLLFAMERSEWAAMGRGEPA